MNDGDKGEVRVITTSPSPAASVVLSSMSALSKNAEMPSESKGKSKEKNEPLLGIFLSSTPHDSLD